MFRQQSSITKRKHMNKEKALKLEDFAHIYKPHIKNITVDATVINKHPIDFVAEIDVFITLTQGKKQYTYKANNAGSTKRVMTRLGTLKGINVTYTRNYYNLLQYHQVE